MSTAATDSAPDAAMQTGFVRVAREEGVVWLTLDRPPLNVLHIPMLEQLDGVLGHLVPDGTVKLVVLTGTGRAFCAGVDVADHVEERVGRMLELFHAAILRLLALECPVIAALKGMALGGGCELLLACDLVLASEDAKIGQPEIKLGVFPPVAAAVLPRLVGRQRALDLILTGRTLSAREAQQIGLVTEVFPAADFDAGVERYLERLAGLSGPVLRLAKRAVTEGMDLPLPEAIGRTERLYEDDLMRLHDAREGLAAFLGKRPPVWKEA